MADVDRVDAPRAAREQHLGEAAGRGADIEADAAARIEFEMIERGRELHAAARHPRVSRHGVQRCIDRDLVRRPADQDVIGGDEAGRNRSLRLGTAREQAALDQQAIGAQTWRHGARLAVRAPLREGGVGDGAYASRIFSVAMSLPSASNTLATMPLASSPALAY